TNHKGAFLFVGPRHRCSIRRRSADCQLVLGLVIRRSSKTDDERWFIERSRRNICDPANGMQRGERVQQRLHLHGVDRPATTDPLPLIFPNAIVAKGCSPAWVSAVFSDANELRVTVNCGLSRPYFGKSDATSVTKFVTCSPASNSINRRASAALAGRLFRLVIVQF